MQIKQITTNTDLYQQERLLRNKILLNPIGQPDNTWEMHDSKAWHFVAINNSNEVIGCVLIVDLNQTKTKVQLMQMAVDTDYQHQGIGSKLVNETERFCTQNQIREIFCHARENAVKFYKNLGFKIEGDAFYEVGIKHFLMQKYL